MTGTQRAIFNQIHRALANCGAMSDLLCITGSFGDTLDDETVLKMLQDWNSDWEIPLISDLKQRAVKQAYHTCSSNVTEAATKLGVGRSTMYRLLKKYGIKL